MEYTLYSHMVYYFINYGFTMRNRPKTADILDLCIFITGWYFLRLKVNIINVRNRCILINS